MKFTSIKVQVREQRMRILPSWVNDVRFNGPGIDLLGMPSLIHSIATKLEGWLHEVEPGVTLRSIVFRFDDRSVIATCEDEGPRPRVLRIDAHSSQTLFDLLSSFLPEIESETREALERRNP